MPTPMNPMEQNLMNRQMAGGPGAAVGQAAPMAPPAGGMPPPAAPKPPMPAAAPPAAPMAAKPAMAPTAGGLSPITMNASMKGMLPGMDPSVIGQNIQHLKSQGVPENEATMVAHKFAQQGK